MVNTRAKIKKTNNTHNFCFSQASTEDSNNHSTRSGALIGSNEDLLIEILLRLPITSILRFKSLSKHWRWLLSHRRFTLLYDKPSKSPGLFVCNMYIPFDVENRRAPPFRSLDFYSDRCGIKIVQSCNGILLCCSDQVGKRSRKYYLFNPTTKQFAIIPSVPGGQNARRTICFMGLVYHPTDCVHYKVVCIRRVEPKGDLFQIQIYSSETGKWKISNESFSANYFFGNGVYWNGAIHWPPSYRNPQYFNIEVEQLQTLPLTDAILGSLRYYSGEAIPMYIEESRGHLHLVELAHDGIILHLIVYEMLGDHSGWFVKYQVDLDDLPGAFPKMIRNNYYDFDIVDVVRGENEEDTFMVVRTPFKLVRYNVHDNSFKLMFNLTKDFYGHSNVHRYTETLTYF